MKRIICILAGFLLALAFLPSGAWARLGKVYFNDGKWLKGDVEVQTEDSGRQIVVIALKSGSVIVPKSDVAKIAFYGNAITHRKFHQALKNTPNGSVAQKTLKAPAVYEPAIAEASKKHRLDPHLVKAVIRQESNFNYRDVSRAGAQGLMQLMPETAKGLGVANSFDPYQNIHGGTRYLRMMLEMFHGDLPRALAAYNAGPNAVKKYGGQVPPYKETQNYVRQVMKYYNLYKVDRLFAFEDPNGRLVFTDRPYTERGNP